MFRNTLSKMLDIRDLKRAEREDGEAGFTLIELLVVVVIIGILIAIAIPLYLNYTQGAKNKGVESDVRAAVAAVQQCYTDSNNTFPGTATISAPATGGNLVLTCPTADNPNNSEKSPVSGNTTLTYSGADTAGNYTIVGSGAGKTFTYTSSTGQISQKDTTAAPAN